MKSMIQSRTTGIDLTTGPIMQKLLMFSFPLIISGIVQQLYVWADLLIIGNIIGATGTVAVATGGEISDIATPFALAFASAGQIYIAQLYGAKEHQNIRKATGTLLPFMIIISLIFLAVTVGFSNGILDLLNCPKEAFVMAKRYMCISAIGMPFIFGYNAICGVLRGMGESRRPLQFICIAAALNVGLDIVLVIWFHMGVAGTAIATVISQFGSFLAAFIYMYQHRDYFQLELNLKYFKIRKKELLIILKLGIPNLIRVIAVQFSMLWVKAMVNDYGLIFSATNSIGGKIEKFAVSFTISVNTASGAMMGQNIGARRVDRATKIMWCTVLYNMILGGIAAILAWLIPEQVFGLFTKDLAVIECGVIFMHIYSVTFLTAAFAGAFKSVINGVGAVMLGLFLGIIDGCVCRIGISLFCANVLDMGAIGYFWGTAFTQLLPGIIAMIYFVSGKWKKRKLLC